MALICVCGGNECYGCGECTDLRSKMKVSCSRCGSAIEWENSYFDYLYEVLCLDCLRALHYRIDTNDISCSERRSIGKA